MDIINSVSIFVIAVFVLMIIIVLFLKRKFKEKILASDSIRIKKIVEDAKIKIAHVGDAGIDLFAIEDVKIKPNEIAKIRTGIIAEIPRGYVGFVKERSGLALDNVDVKAGVIDSTYRGEIIVVLRNMRNEILEISKYDPIAQLVVLKILEPKIELIRQLSETERGTRGFTSRFSKIQANE